MLAAVVEAGVFEYLHKHGPTSVSSIASALNLDKGTLHVYFSNLAFMELISAYADKKTGEEIVSLTKVSKAHLLKSSGINMVPLLQIMLSPYASTVTALNAAERLRTGHLPEGHAHAASPEHEFWKVFAKVSNDMAVEGAQDLISVFEKRGILLASEDSRELTIIDTACSSGGYGSEFAQRLPNSRVTFFDFDYVVEITQKEVAKNYNNHILSRSEFVGGDLFKFDHDKLGMYDIALAPQIFHHFSYEESMELATTYFKALKPGGWLGVVEMLRAHDRIPNHPYDFVEFPVLFNLMMKMTTLTGQAFAEADMVEILESAGFREVEAVSMFPKPHALVIARKPN
jgi:DNA-binding MarR family transcriptional regulator